MNDSYLYLFVKAVVTLMFLLGLFGGALYIFRRLSGHQGVSVRARSAMKVITTLFLGQKKNIAVVEIAGEYLVVGITPAAITCLGKLDRPEAIDEMKRLESLKKNPLLNLFQQGL